MNLSEHIIETVRLDPSHESPLMFGANRWDWLPRLFTEAGFTVGAEIGVGSGRFAERLCKTVPGLRLYAIDPWEVYEYYEGRVSRWRMEGSFNKAVFRLAPLNCQIVKKYSLEAAADVPDNALDFVYIDADRRYDSVWADLAAWTPKVRAGGVISGCCYYNEAPEIGQVKDAVDDWTEAHCINPWFIAVHYRYPVYFWEKS